MKNVSLIKTAALAALLLSIALLTGYANVRDYLDPEKLNALISGLGPWGPAAYILIYSIAPVLLLPGLPLTIAGGIIFGPVGGTVYTAIGATTGATAAFIISRYLARGFVSGLLKEGRWNRLDQEVEQHGWKIVAFTRLIPVFPFNLLNYAFGLTRIRLSHYIIASFIFMLPAIIAFVVFGSSIPGLLTGKISTEFAIGMVLIIIVSAAPFIYKIVKKKR